MHSYIFGRLSNLETQQKEESDCILYAACCFPRASWIIANILGCSHLQFHPRIKVV